MDNWRECQTSVYEELRELKKMICQLNEQITEMRIEQAIHREKINEGRRFHASVWGVVGGAVSAVAVAVIDFIFKK